jgi:hypothetical protein
MVPGQRIGNECALIVVALLAAACQAAPVATRTAVADVPSAAPSSGPTAAASLTPVPTAAASLTPVPAGAIAFMRSSSDGEEHYFTIKSDGTDEREIYTAEGCSCIHWMADGSRVMSLGESGKDVWSLMTIRPDGSDRVVIPTPIKTLSLAVGATSSDGKWLAFNGWDNDVPSNAGLYLARPDLSDLRLVVPLQKGMNGIEPFGVTPDGSKVVFFVDTGPQGETTHSGDVYVVNADGSKMRRLNPVPATTGYIGPPVISLSPDGHMAAFDVGEQVFVADLETGKARPISDRTGFAWAVAWSPAGDWITYTRNHGGTNVISLIRPDGTDAREISSTKESDEAANSVWSPDGTTLLVQRDEGGRDDLRNLWIMDLEGNYLGQVTHQPSAYGSYSWAPAAH